MRVMVVDDNAIVRAGLRTILERLDMVDDVVEAADASEAMDVASGTRPDFCFLDYSMPGRTGLEILPDLALRMSVVMLTSVKDPSLVRQALEAGARGYLVHGQLGQHEVAGAIETCMHGGVVLGREAALAALEGASDSVHPLGDVVTAREGEILSLAADGLSNRTIASRLYLSERTVKNYLNSAYPKIGVHNRAEAVAAWLKARGG